MKKINVCLLTLMIGFMLIFSDSASADRTVYQQNKVTKNEFSTKQTSMQYAARRYYRSRSYRPSTPNPSYRSPRGGTGRNFLGYAGAFGLGSLFGSMFHPFGGGYGYGGFGGGFSILGLLLDIFFIWLIFSFIRRIFRRNNRY